MTTKAHLATTSSAETESCLTCLCKSDCSMMLKSEVQRMTRINAMQYPGDQGGLVCKTHRVQQQENTSSEVTEDA